MTNRLQSRCAASRVRVRAVSGRDPLHQIRHYQFLSYLFRPWRNLLNSDTTVSSEKSAAKNRRVLFRSWGPKECRFSATWAQAMKSDKRIH
jgi:hypothetical protein